MFRFYGVLVRILPLLSCCHWWYLKFSFFIIYLLFKRRLWMMLFGFASSLCVLVPVFRYFLKQQLLHQQHHLFQVSWQRQCMQWIVRWQFITNNNVGSLLQTELFLSTPIIFYWFLLLSFVLFVSNPYSLFSFWWLRKKIVKLM